MYNKIFKYQQIYNSQSGAGATAFTGLGGVTLAVVGVVVTVGGATTEGGGGGLGRPPCGG